jgi:hypothetical protein
MVARVTLVEVDSVRTSVTRAVEHFKLSVLPELRDEPGYEGCYVLTTPEGKAIVMTLWTDAEAAEAGIEGGGYASRVEKFVTVIKAAPGRETYDVDLIDEPALA